MPDLCKSSLVVHMYSEYCTCMGPLSRAFPLHFCIDGWVAACSAALESYIFQKKNQNNQRTTGWSGF